VSSSDLESDEEGVVLYGPRPLPGNGRGSITGQQREIIMEATQCSAAVRKRAGWATQMLTVSGPLKNLNKAKTMALTFILQTQAEGCGDECAETPGAEADPASTIRMEQKADSKKARQKRKKQARRGREKEKAQQRLNLMQMHPMPMMGLMPGMCATQMPFPMMQPMMQQGVQMPMWRMHMPMLPTPIKTEQLTVAPHVKKETGVAATPVKQETEAMKKQTGATPVKKEVKTETGAQPKKGPWKKKLELECNRTAFQRVQESDGDLLEQARPAPIKITIESDDEVEPFEDNGPAVVRVPKQVKRSAPTENVEARLNKILVYAVGWQEHGCAHSKDINGYVEQLQEIFRWRYKNLLPIRYYMNCHKFRGQESGHVGLFDEDVANLVNHHHFKPWLRAVKGILADIQNDLAGDEHTIRLVMVCKAGRNRSVAAKVVLDYLFDWLGYRTNDKNGFLSKSSWTRTKKTFCFTCRGCTEMTWKKERACWSACQLWTSL
jgi:hypothetical protein